jgi:uncharacterized protein YfiM (DUF2279 family)
VFVRMSRRVAAGRRGTVWRRRVLAEDPVASIHGAAARSFRGRRHPAVWFPNEVLPGEVWLLRFVKLVGAVVMYLGPTTVAAGRVTAGAAVAAAAVDTGAAMAMVVRAVTRCVRVSFMSNLSIGVSTNLHVDRPAAAGVAPVVLGA